MAISKKELTENIQKNEFGESSTAPEPSQIKPLYGRRKTVYMTGQKPKGRPKSMEGYGRVRISLYISEELDNRIENLLDRNVETKNQLIIRLLEQSCDEESKNLK